MNEEAAIAEETTSDEVSEVEATEPVETQETEGEATTPESEDDKPKRRNRVQERIDELTRAKYELEARAQAAETQLQQQQGQLAQREHQDERPTLEQFGYDETAYAQAMQEWTQQGFQRQVQAQTEQQQYIQQQAQQMQAQRDLEVKFAKAQEKYPDFVEAIQSPGLPKMGQENPYAYQAIVQSDQMADVAMHLSRNPEAAHNLAAMSPIDAVKEVARLEQMLSKPAPTPKPQPPSRVSGRNDVAPSPESMTPDEYRKWWQANH